jgi:hypothetical protein
MMRTLVTRSSERVHNSLVRVPAVDAALVSVLLLTLGLTFSPARAGAQTVSQAFVNLFSGARLYVDPASAAKQQDPEIRKRAMFWLGQSNDPRAIDLFEQLLTKK